MKNMLKKQKKDSEDKTEKKIRKIVEKIILTEFWKKAGTKDIARIKEILVIIKWEE